MPRRNTTIEKLPECLAEFIKDIRDARDNDNITLKELKEKTKLGLEWIHKLEQGKILNPTVGSLQRLAEALGFKLKITLE